MTQYVFNPPAPPSLEVENSDLRFPVGRIFCVGQNYAAHAAEMGSTVARDAPWYFTKSQTAIAQGGDVPYPPGTQNYHHEVELVVALGEDAEIFGYAVGLDMTRRDLQLIAKEKRRPWDAAKDTEAAAIIGALSTAFVPEEQVISLLQNGETRQSAKISEMVWSIPEILTHLSTLYTLRAGDIIMTGTPSGVGPVDRGDQIEARVEGLPGLRVTMV
ncbi:MAG: fumarylacetoacetate hydrolase family protein [Pseudomonadota bacterium]